MSQEERVSSPVDLDAQQATELPPREALSLVEPILGFPFHPPPVVTPEEAPTLVGPEVGPASPPIYEDVGAVPPDVA